MTNYEHTMGVAFIVHTEKKDPQSLTHSELIHALEQRLRTLKAENIGTEWADCEETLFLHCGRKLKMEEK